MAQGQVSFIGVGLAAVAAMAVGALWYSPRIFGDAWLDMMGWSKDDLAKRKQGLSRAYAMSFVAMLILSYVLAHVISSSQVATLQQGAHVGFGIWLGFVATTGAVTSVFEGKSPKLYLINSGYHLVSLLVMGGLLATLRR